jgi:hypothetical protein
VIADIQLELDFAAADARDDETPFADWVRSLPPTPWAKDEADRDG